MGYLKTVMKRIYAVRFSLYPRLAFRDNCSKFGVIKISPGSYNGRDGSVIKLKLKRETRTPGCYWHPLVIVPDDTKRCHKNAFKNETGESKLSR